MQTRISLFGVKNVRTEVIRISDSHSVTQLIVDTVDIDGHASPIHIMMFTNDGKPPAFDISQATETFDDGLMIGIGPGCGGGAND